MLFPHVMELDFQCDIRSWVNSHREELNSTVETQGAVLIRGARISEPIFKDVVYNLSIEHLQYMYRSTPRTDLGGGIFTATEYPPGLDIPLHNENAYQREWPMRLIFYCAYPADGGGGQTPLARTMDVSRRIAPAIWEQFRQKQIMYIRNFRPDVDLPWQTVFQTQSKADVEAYCRTHDISFEWKSDGNLKTWQICRAFAKHPRRDVVVWFNQVHLFHPSALDPATWELMSEMFKEEDFPRNVTYGDGSPISEADLQQIREAFAQETITFSWRAGDLLLLDNMLVSHGRRAYKGKRRVLVAMYDSYSASPQDLDARPA
jgi:Taurine catabolism dioxygenase TauD, TfdA family